MSQPSANIIFNSLCQRLADSPLTITLPDNRLVSIIQVPIEVYPGIVKIDEAEFFVTLTPEENFLVHFKNLVKETFLNPPRLVIGVAWLSHSGPLGIPYVPAHSGAKSEDDQSMARAIHSAFFSQSLITMKPRVGSFAIPLFTVEGHKNAYLTDIATTPIPLGRNYTLVASVAGLNLPETDRIWFRLELRDWNHVRVSPDTVVRRLLRKARILS
ncbi:MAG TPA: hypothetical protein VJZ32_11000 [Candidatus Bathyarchaeia archaeon]|nr:hypothetical protein [Candidatus Bathyarchaeia archaeon]